MGSSVLLVLIVPIMVVDFIDTHFGTNLDAAITDFLTNAIHSFVESGMADKLAEALEEFFVK